MTVDDETSDTLPESAVQSRELAPGAKIGRHIVLDTIGAGGTGIVYAAHDPELDRRIAVKLLRATGDTGRARVRREAQALARADHPNIVTVHDVGDHGDGLFIAMELVGGGTLREWQARHTWREVLAAYLEAGRGLAAAHARGLVHRDFKPENVLVTADDRIRVTDFGLAMLAEGAGAPSPALTADGYVMGTIGYMSPEQCDGDPVDARSDQYAWCICVWEALYGKRPFRGTTLVEIAASMSGPIVIPDTPAIPKAIGRALVRGLAVAPEARWPAMEPLLAACTLRRGRRRQIAAIGAGVLVVTGAIVFGVTSRASAPAETCVAGASRVAGIWDPARKAALASHFATVARPDVATALGLATRDFDTYASTWSAQWDGACTSPDRTRDPLLYAQRINCLERSLVDLQGLVEAYLEVDPGRFAASWRGNAFALWATPLADCERVASIRATPPAPLPANREEIMHLIVDMHRARVEARSILNSGRADRNSLDAPLARIDAITTRLDQLGSPAAAEAAAWHSTYVEGRRRVTNGQESTVDRAIALARKYRDDRRLAFSSADAVAHALDVHDAALARGPLRETTEAYERSGGDPRHLELGAAMAIEEGHFAEALDAIHAARAPGDALDHFAPDVMASEESRILVLLGRMPEAITAARRHLAFLEGLWRGDHWIVADAHELLAHVLLYAHDAPGALAELHASLEMHARIGSGPNRLQSAQFLVLACATLLGLDGERETMAKTIAVTDVEPHYEALDLASWAPGLVPWALANARSSPEVDYKASFAAYVVGDLDTAERIAARTPIRAATIDDVGDRFLVLALVAARRGHPVSAQLAVLERFHSSTKPADADRATAYTAYLEAARGHWAAARTLLERAPLTTLLPGGDERAWLDAILGRALVEAHEPARAIRFLERCLYWSVQVRFSWQNANYLVADASLALARALWDSGGDKVRARALATLAIAQYTTFQAADRAVAERWLAEHG